MGLFKAAKKMVKKAIDHPLATAAGLALSAGLGPAGFGLTSTLTAAGIGSAASMALSGGLGGKKGSPEPGALPVSPFEGLTPVTQDAALRAQSEGQRATGGGVAGQEGESDLMAEDEIKKRRASRMLLG